jgi:hypothetical protein
MISGNFQISISGEPQEFSHRYVGNLNTQKNLEFLLGLSNN